MRKSYKSFLILIVILISGSIVFAKPAKPKPEPVKTLLTNNFTLSFSKPAEDKFFFSDPQFPDNYYGKEVEGVGFPKAGIDKKSTANIGITFDLDTNGTLEVFCNAENNRSSEFMMKSGSTTGLTFDTVVSQLKVADPSPFNYNPTNDAKKPVFIYTNSASMDATAYYLLNMTIDTSNVVSGQYEGYLIMIFTPSV